MVSLEECKKVLGFNHVSEKFTNMYFSNHPEGLYELTPIRAKFILDYLNKDNRKPKPSQTKAIDTSIEEDGWQDDGDTLRFNKEGNIPEYQHRLKVLVERGLTVWIAVVTGCSMDTNTHTAGARPRKPVDEIQRVYNNDSTLRDVSSDEVTTLNSVLARRKGDTLTMKNCVNMWGKWENWIIDGEQISEKFFKRVPQYDKWRRIVSSWAALMSFTGKREIAINLLDMLEDEILDIESRPLTKGLIQFQKDEPDLTWTNTQQSNLVWYILCHATDKILKQSDGRIQFELNGSQANHDNMRKKGVYRDFLFNPDNISNEAQFISN